MTDKDILAAAFFTALVSAALLAVVIGAAM
jgi:hypothetical protein